MKKELDFRSLKRAKGVGRRDLKHVVRVFKTLQEIAYEEAEGEWDCTTVKNMITYEICEDIINYLQGIIDKKEGW